jgi:hypothetical protein
LAKLESSDTLSKKQKVRSATNSKKDWKNFQVHNNFWASVELTKEWTFWCTWILAQGVAAINTSKKALCTYVPMSTTQLLSVKMSTIWLKSLSSY